MTEWTLLDIEAARKQTIATARDEVRAMVDSALDEMEVFEPERRSACYTKANRAVAELVIPAIEHKVEQLRFRTRGPSVVGEMPGEI